MDNDAPRSVGVGGLVAKAGAAVPFPFPLCPVNCPQTVLEVAFVEVSCGLASLQLGRCTHCRFRGVPSI